MPTHSLVMLGLLVPGLHFEVSVRTVCILESPGELFKHSNAWDPHRCSDLIGLGVNLAFSILIKGS